MGSSPQSDALSRLLELGPHNTVTEDEERPGSIWHYHLPEGREIVVYPLLFGEALLCTGRIDRDGWEHGYHYRTPDEAVEAATAWTDTEKPPPGDFIKEHHY